MASRIRSAARGRKAQLGRQRPATEGAIFITVNDSDKRGVTRSRGVFAMGSGWWRLRDGKVPARRGIPTESVLKIFEGRPNGVDLMLNGEIKLLINTPLGKESQRDDYTMRQAAIANHVAYTTTLSAANAACDAILSLRSRAPSVLSLQEWHARIPREAGV